MNKKIGLIILALVILLGIVITGCIGFGPGGENPSNNTNASTAGNKNYENQSNMQTTFNYKVSWIKAGKDVSEKIDKLNSQLKLMGANLNLTNVEVANNSGILRITTNLGNKTTYIYMTPEGKKFWFDQMMVPMGQAKNDIESVRNYLKSILKPGVQVQNFTGKGKSLGMEVYNFTISYNGQTIPLSIYRLGNKLVPGVQMLDIFSPNKVEKPEVKLFVMSFCPFGRMAEKIMKPVYDLLKDKVNFTVHYILYPSQYYQGQEDNFCIGSYCSMHGVNEAREDARQICMQKLYPGKFWDYIYKIASSDEYSASNIENKWRGLAESLGMNTSKIEECAKNAEELLEKESQIDKEYGVSASPTIYIGSQRYDWGRWVKTPEAFKEAICMAFKNKPEECNQTIATNSTSTAPSGSCGS